MGSGTQITARGDTRVTFIGSLLRCTKLDELPQLLNVVRGEMSLVGPRPETPGHVAAYTKDQRTILHLRPGITGAASLSNLDEESLMAKQGDPEDYYLHVQMPRKLQLELRYYGNLGMVTDVSLILLTLAAVLNPFRGASSEGLEAVRVRFNAYIKRMQVTLDGWIFACSFAVAYLSDSKAHRRAWTPRNFYCGCRFCWLLGWL